MGKKKKFIDKKRAATFLLLARDSSDLSQSSGPDCNHVFVRVDNNPFTIGGLDENRDGDSNSENLDNDPGSVLADAPENEEFDGGTGPSWQSGGHSGSLPDHIRKGILELGFPDDGYNYLDHFREIKHSGAGSEYYLNPKLNLDLVPLDVKAYDASMVRVKAENVHANEKRVMYGVSEKSVNVKVQKAVDLDVVALLDDSNSDLGSDVEDLEEDFVVQANCLEEQEGDSSSETGCGSTDESKQHKADAFSSKSLNNNIHQARDRRGELVDRIDESPRARRLLDGQFDMLELQEYGTDSDGDYDASVGGEEKPLSKKLNNVLKNHQIDGLELYDNYKTPADFLCGDNKSNGLCGSAADVIQRCAEYAEKCEDADEGECEVAALEENSNESEARDCETVISTYSNCDNHSGRIGESEFASKKKLDETISGTVKSNNNTNIISLHGKERFPVGYLPHGKSPSKEKLKLPGKTDKPINRQQLQESKEEKKERKSAVKEEKREARLLKKETKLLYQGETKRGQKAASVSGPSSIRLT